jgi:hypothetical protein
MKKYWLYYLLFVKQHFLNNKNLGDFNEIDFLTMKADQLQKISSYHWKQGENKLS